MLTDQEIQDLVQFPKEILQRTPSKGYRQDNRHKRCDLQLQDLSGKGFKFDVFVRRSEQFIENFSLGLIYHPTGVSGRGLTLIRYNGAHGEVSRHSDGHYNKPHIHRLTEEELNSGTYYPQESHRALTQAYSSFEEAIGTFFQDLGVRNYGDHFPDSLQGVLFSGN